MEKTPTAAAYIAAENAWSDAVKAHEADPSEQTRRALNDASDAANKAAREHFAALYPVRS